LQARRTPFPCPVIKLVEHARSWEITYFNSHGHVQHIATAKSEPGALRVARQVAELYGYKGKVLIQNAHGLFEDRI